MTSSLGSIYLLEQLTKLREMFYLLDDQFIIRGYNSRTARKKEMHEAQRCMRYRASMPSPRIPLSPNLRVFTNLVNL